MRKGFRREQGKGPQTANECGAALSVGGAGEGRRVVGPGGSEGVGGERWAVELAFSYAFGEPPRAGAARRLPDCWRICVQLPREVRDHLWARVGYRPYAEQLAAHNSEARIRLIAGGERAGKSRSAAMELAGRFLEGQLYWLVGPDYDLCRPEFAYLIEALEALDAIETLATPTGSRTGWCCAMGR